MASRPARILILCKTYPSPSGKHVETSCVAGFEENGKFIRLFPVPFRLVDDDKKFKKWQWIKARVEKAKNDHRPESHRLFIDTITVEGEPLSVKLGWRDRRKVLDRIQVFDDFAALDQARISTGITLGLLRPSRILCLDITRTENPDWTAEEREKLVQNERQGGLFDAADERRIATLRKLPFDFHYRYSCEIQGDSREYRHKIADWEAGALYWKCRRSYGTAWEAPFRAKLEKSLPAADLTFLMGTIHRFPDQWLIVSLIYPPKQQSGAECQGSLFGL
ncbi:hypothetical protein DU475_23035 [Rhodopseudomonas sp. WA056]|uniref:hypothetical protein n=1 Tax=Rhodopseudomonas sp. WA056 TaxID=2269367 RepID=UPI0013E0166C|nr:hypothetical protein [Rhodopseudomonas sp. WA056]NEW90120.1 hypothetical protein [Rhodopseudomonas sp. WA056]